MELHSHMHYSNLRLLNCINRPEDLIKHAIELGLAGIAVTDHGSLASHVELAGMSSFWDQDLLATQIAVTDIDLSQCQLSLCGAKKNTLRIIFPNGIVGVKFGITEDDFNKLHISNMYMTCNVMSEKEKLVGN